MFRDMPVKHRLIFGFSGMLAIMAALALIVHLQMIEQRTHALSISELNPQVQAATSLALSTDRKRTALRGYIVTGNRQLYDEYLQNAAAQQSSILELRRLMTEPNELVALAALEPLITQMSQDEARVLEVIEEGDRDRAFALQQSGVREHSQQITSAANNIAANALARIHDATVSFQSQSSRLMAVTRGMFGLALLLALVFVIATVRSIMIPTRRVAEAAGAVARGNYDEVADLGLANKGVSAPRNELKQLAVAIAGMARDLEKRERSLAAHADIASVAASSLQLDLLADSALAEVAQHTGSDVGAICLQRDGALLPFGVYGISAEAADTALSGADGLIAEAAKSGKPIILSDIPDDTKLVISPGLGKLAPKSFACIPMVVESGTIGVLALASLRAYDSETLALMKSVASQIGIAISNALYHNNVQQLAEELRVSNEQLDSQNEELQSQNEELHAQSEEIQAQSEEIHSQNEELQSQGIELRQRNLELEMATRDLQALQAVTAAAFASVDQESILRGMIESTAAYLGLGFGLMMMHDEERGVLTATAGYNVKTGADGPFELAIGEGFSGTVAGTRQILTTLDARTDNFVLNPYVKEAGVKAMVGLPLAVGDHLYGVVLLGSSESTEFSDREKHLLQVLAARTAVALERAGYYQGLEKAEARAREDRARLQMIIDNIPEAMLIASAAEGRIIIANKAALSLAGLGSLPRGDAWDYGMALDIRDSQGERIPTEELALMRSLRNGETCVGVEFTIKGPDGKRLPILCNSVPIKDEDGTMTGAIGVYQDVTVMKEQQRWLQEGYERQRSVAETLQKSFLPGVSPQLDGYEIADVYAPAHEHAQVGGDFYDIIVLGNNQVGIVIADVSGKGVEAAVHTAMAKYMLQGFAHEDPEPSRVITKLNDVVTRTSEGELFITLFYGVLDIESRKFTYASAGHERPLLLKADSRSCLAFDSTGPVLGIIPDVTYKQQEELIAEGDALVLYTDGITECRRGGKFLGQEGLEDIILAIGPVAANEMATEIMERVRDYAQGRLHDDVALLVIKAEHSTNEG